MKSNANALALERLREEVIGIDTLVPLLDGSQRRYVFLDNAASTPTFRSVVQCIEEFLPWYAGVHRGVGLKAVVATTTYDQAHRIACEFVGADLSKNVTIFVKNTTESINKLANRLNFRPDDVVVSTLMEHHSNDLPWRKHCRVVHVGVGADGAIDLDTLRHELKRYERSVKLVAVSGASNVTGICNPIHDIAEWTHDVGAKIFVDAAQLVPHRPVSMLPDDDPRHIDFLAYSAHKVYAPFGIGVLIGPLEFFAEGVPDAVGGGTVSYVGISPRADGGLEEVEWGELPQREEAGSPNVVGAVALAKALAMLKTIGMETIAEHEGQLLEYALSRMKKISGLYIYGPTEDLQRKMGVIPFNVEGMDHALVATILSTEGGIGVRNGNFCAQPYMRKLLNVTAEEEKQKRAARCDYPSLPGMVRASFGCYNNKEDVDAFVDMLERVARREHRGSYSVDPLTGRYVAKGFRVDPAKLFWFLGDHERLGQTPLSAGQTTGEELA